MHDPQEDWHMESMDNFRERFEVLARIIHESETRSWDSLRNVL